jgi:aspartate kinase
VVTGGQGISRDTLDYTTLGRGASDTSGVAVGVALGARKVEIFTDVDGVAVADPRVVPDAGWLDRVSYDAMHELARFGAKVIHPRAVLAGRTGRVPIAIRSTFSTKPGTVIGEFRDEAPIVGLTTLGSMQTVAVRSGAVDPETRRDWERRRVIMSLVDARSGDLLVGAAADRAGELHAALAVVGVSGQGVASRAGVSLVGETDALRIRLARDEPCLTRAGVAVAGYEHTDRRTTYVVGAADAERAVQALYRDIFARSNVEV